LIAAKLVITK